MNARTYIHQLSPVAAVSHCSKLCSTSCVSYLDSMAGRFSTKRSTVYRRQICHRAWQQWRTVKDGWLCCLSVLLKVPRSVTSLQRQGPANMVIPVYFTIPLSSQWRWTTTACQYDQHRQHAPSMSAQVPFSLKTSASTLHCAISIIEEKKRRGHIYS